MKMRLFTSAIIAAGIVGAANAQLLYAPTAGDHIVTAATGNFDDTFYNPASPGNFDLVGFTMFGSAVTAANMRCTVNGNISFGATATSNGYTGSSWVNVPLGWTSSTANTSMIAPFYDDLYFTGVGTTATSKSIRVQKPAAGIYVMTWQGAETFLNTSPDLNFQAIMYGDGNGMTASGTITFCYGTMAPGTATLTATVGLNSGSGAFAATPLGSGADITGAMVENSCHTFTPDGQGGYTYRAGVVPEPASMTALGLGALAMLRRRRSK